jgi:hypothetical protein
MSGEAGLFASLDILFLAIAAESDVLWAAHRAHASLHAALGRRRQSKQTE